MDKPITKGIVILVKEGGNYVQKVIGFALEDRTPRPMRKILSFGGLELKKKRCNNALVRNTSESCYFWRYGFCTYDEFGCSLTKEQEIEA